MTSGIFSAAFMSNQQKVGCGVAIFTGNTIHGGDASCYYRGKYRLDGNNQIVGTIDVAQYSTAGASIFGPITEFRLILTGHIITNETAFELSGYMEDQPQLKIRIILNKLEELIEA